MSLETRILAAIQAIGADIKALFTNKQDTLVSGTNIKTVNGQSVLGTGDLTVAGGGGSGDVVGPASSVDLAIPMFSGTTGKLLTQSPLAHTVAPYGGVMGNVQTVGVSGYGGDAVVNSFQYAVDTTETSPTSSVRGVAKLKASAEKYEDTLGNVQWMESSSRLDQEVTSNSPTEVLFASAGTQIGVVPQFHEPSASSGISTNITSNTTSRMAETQVYNDIQSTGEATVGISKLGIDDAGTVLHEHSIKMYSDDSGVQLCASGAPLDLATPDVKFSVTAFGELTTGPLRNPGTAGQVLTSGGAGQPAAWATLPASGDMAKATYDTDNDGKVDAAEVADSVPWSGITGVPTEFTPSAHGHTISDVTGLQAALDSALGTDEDNLRLVNSGETWTSQTTPVTVANGAVAYGNGKFVTFTTQQSVYSLNGKDWTNFPENHSENARRIAYGNGVFVAVHVTSTANARYSTDGISWQTSTLPATAFWMDITFGAGLFVAVSTSGNIATSPDGVSWTARTSPNASTWQAVCFGGGKFIAAANNSTSWATSANGIDWTTLTSINGNWRDSCYGSGTFVAVRTGTSIAYSRDGVVWTPVTVPNKSWLGVAYGNGLFVAVAADATADNIMTSKDGVNWTTQTSPAVAYSGVAYGNQRFVAVPQNPIASVAYSDSLSGGQNELVSGTNIKTLAGNSLLGSGDLPLPVHTHAIADVTNLQTSLDAKQATLVSGTNIKTINGSSILGSGDLVIAGGSGSGDVVGPASAAANHLVTFADTTGKLLQEAVYFDSPATAIPAAPAAGDLRWFARSRAGRILPHVIGPSGIDVALQPALFGNSIYMWMPGTGTTLGINFGTSFTARNSGTGAAQSHPTKSSTNAMTSLNRASFGTGTTTTGASGVQSSATVAWRGNAAGLGGFFFFARFGIESLAADMRAFVGLSANSSAMGADSSSWNNTIGIGKDSADANWQIICRGTAVTKTNTNKAVVAGDVLDMMLFAPPNGSNITVRLVNAVTGVVYVDDLALTANLPAATTFLLMQAHCQSVTGTTSKSLSLNRMYCETDL